MKKRKAVVLYGSLTGNTEMVGKAFAEVLEEYGFETRCEKLVGGKDWSNDPVYFKDYDIVVLGSLIVAGLPYKEVYQLLGLQGNRTIMGKALEPPKQGEPLDPDSNPMGRLSSHSGIPGIVAPSVATGSPGAKGDNLPTIYGVVYATYGGSGVGPPECYGSLEVMEDLLRVNGVRTVGKFACPGKEMRHEAVDGLAKDFNMNIADVQAMLQRWSLDPEAEEFQKMGKEKTDIIAKYMNAGDDYSMLEGNDPLGIGKPGSTFWHYDSGKRPSKRDLTKAKIFMAEIIEDYFLTTTGDPRPPYAMYTCIS
jgi:roadblock/LC7 domain-containing protein